MVSPDGQTLLKNGCEDVHFTQLESSALEGKIAFPRLRKIQE